MWFQWKMKNPHLHPVAGLNLKQHDAYTASLSSLFFRDIWMSKELQRIIFFQKRKKTKTKTKKNTCIWKNIINTYKRTYKMKLKAKVKACWANRTQVSEFYYWEDSEKF